MSLAEIKRVINTEMESLSDLISRIDDTYLLALDLMHKCPGRVIVTGMGKSGIIAHKISATLSSTGTPSAYLNAAEAIHGDMGIIKPEDILLVLSRSGGTDEVKIILEHVKLLDVKIIGILGDPKSPLAEKCDLVLDASVKEEACPYGLAPTASTTAALAIGDALAVALISRRGFTEIDFAFLHPGGALGRRLTMTITDIMHSGDDLPIVNEDSSLQEVIFEITSKMLGATAVVDKNKKIIGIITDGDLRRLLEKTHELNGIRAKEVMSPDPKTVKGDILATRGINIMEKFNITQLIIVDYEDTIVGMVHLHDLLKAGIN